MNLEYIEIICANIKRTGIKKSEIVCYYVNGNLYAVTRSGRLFSYMKRGFIQVPTFREARELGNEHLLEVWEQ